MRKVSKEDFAIIEHQNPLLEIVANITSKVTGVSLEEMKSRKTSHHIAVARAIYANVCRRVVFPQYYIPYYIGKHEMALKHWYDMQELLYKKDISYTLMADKVKSEFDDILNKLKNV